jgi:diguanylate cyclase (GGDEF)-like protein
MLIRVGPFLASAVLSVAMAIALAGRVLDLRVQRDLALRMAETDAMTGLLNRRGGQAQLRDMFRRNREFRLALSVLFIDLDELKPVNDSLGHEAGDACLLGLANLLNEHLPAGAALSRWGGDEFVMLLPGYDSRSGKRLAEDIARHWALTPVRYGGQTLRLTASLGLATLSVEDADPESLLQRADAAVYRAKYAGRNRVEVAEADLISATLPQTRQAGVRVAGR